MVEEKVTIAVMTDKGKKPRRMRRYKVKNPSTGEYAAQRDRLNAYMNEVLDDLRDAFYKVETIQNVYPATREGVERAGRTIAGILVDRGFKASDFIQGLLEETTEMKGVHHG